MQIIYINTSGKKYLWFHFQNMKAKKSFASRNLTARCLCTKRVQFISDWQSVATDQILHYLRRDERKNAPTPLI